MKNIFKRLLPFVLALVMMVGLLPALTVHTQAAGSHTWYGRYVFRVEGLWCTEGCPANGKGAEAVVSNAITGTNFLTDGLTVRYQWSSVEHSEECTFSSNTYNGLSYFYGPFTCTSGMNVDTVVPATKTVPQHRITITHAAMDHALKEATAASDGKHTGKCTQCYNTVTLSCNYSDATCSAPATCELCGQTTGEKNPAAHDWKSWRSSKNGTHTRTCKLDSNHTETGDCSGGTVTCTAAAVCEVCNKPYGEALGHKLASEFIGYDYASILCERYDSCHYGAEIRLEMSEDDYEYTGNPITPGIAVYPEDWPLEKNSITYENNTNVGKAVAKLAVPGGEISVDFWIVSTGIDSADVTVTPASAPYTGEAHTPTVALTHNGKALVEGTDYTVDQWSGNLTDAGEYKATITGKGNFGGSMQTNAYTITEAELPAVTFTQTNTLVYTGEALTPEVTPSVSVSNGNTITYTYSATADGSYETTLPSFTDAGTHTVYYKAVASNHKDGSGSFTVTIDKAENEWTINPAIADWTYGEGTAAYAAEAKTGGTVTVTYTGKTNAGVDYSSADAPTEAGEYEAIFSVAETDNYKALEAKVSFTVRRAKLSAEDFTYVEPELVYNGQSQHGKIVVSAGDVPRKNIWIKYKNIDLGLEEVPVDAGNYSFEIRVEELPNYEMTDYMSRDDWKFTIKKATPSITWDETEFTYDKMPHGFATIELVDGSDYSAPVTYSYTKQGSSTTGRIPVDAGTYTVTVTTTELSNYEAATASATIIINPKPITPTVAIDGESYTYSGIARRPSATVRDGADILKETDYVIGYENNVEPGEATVVINPRAGGNYTFDTVRVYFLIMPNASALEGITPENVTSAYQDIIDEIQAQMEGKNVGNLTEDQQQSWEALEDRLKELEEAIAKIREQMEKIIEETAELPEHPTGDDLDKINELLDIYDDIEDQLTGEEKEDLADEIEKLKTERDHIEQTNKAVEEALADADEILSKELTDVDRTELEELIDRIEELLQDPHLTEEQEKELQEALDALNKVRDEILEIVQKITDDTAGLGDHPTTDKLDEIEDLLDLYDEYKDQLTDEEKAALADEIEKLETEKAHIEKTNEAVEDALNDTEELLDKDLTHADEDEVDELIDRIEELLEDPHLTEEQEKELQDALDKLNDIKDDFDAAAEVEEMIDELPKTGKPDDEDLRDEYQAVKDAYDKLPNKDLVNPKAVAKLEKLAKALRDYKIIKGNAQRWYKNDEELVNLSFTANGPYDKFAYIKIDGEILDPKHYTSKEGSTIVTLKASYLETLSYAKHTIAIGYEDGDLSGEATGYFRVTLHTDSPATGDTTNIMLLGLLAMSSLLGIAALVIARKKRGA